ncbi:MAG: lysophospholipid acyltransferase family protein [Verrucomicrobiota bacterium]
MKPDSSSGPPSASLPNGETEAQRIVTINFAGPATDAEPTLAATRDALLPQPIGQSPDAGELHSPRTGRRACAAALPTVSQPLLSWFTWYSRRYLRRHFNSLRVSRAGPRLMKAELPLVIYSNHASWWDPLVALLLAGEFLPGQRVFAPMDAAALEQYGFFKRLGAFGVEQGTRRGAAQFLRLARTVLQQPDTVLWLTPQSRFADARERPVSFKAGIGHLPKAAGQLCFVPVAIEYVFWAERLPEILVRFGEPYETCAKGMQLEPQMWTEFFAGQLADTQNALAAEARQRQPDKFRCLWRGHSGVGGCYDRWRALKAKWRGETFQPQHGKL